jgi:tetratricopeptide (TPR) repeat protein
MALDLATERSPLDGRHPGPRGGPGGPGGERTPRPAPRRRWPAFLIEGLLIAGLLVPIVRDEIDPPALREAAAAYGRNDLETALRKALDHLDRRPASRAAALLAARCLSRLDFAEKAEPYYRRAGPLGLDDRHVRAYGLVRANRREEAVGAYQDILARRPDDVLALRRLAAVRIAQARRDEALALADRLIRIPSGAVIGHTLAGVVHHDTESPERAVAAFERVLALDPDLRLMPLNPSSMFWTYLAQDLLALGRPAEARRGLARALSGSGDATLAGLMGQAYRQEGDFDEAERWWRQASEWDPTLVEPWLNLGRLMLQRDRPGEAIAPLSKAAAVAPKASEPLYSLSLANRRLGRQAEADRLRAEADRLRGQSNPPPRGMGTQRSPAS